MLTNQLLLSSERLTDTITSSSGPSSLGKKPTKSLNNQRHAQLLHTARRLFSLYNEWQEHCRQRPPIPAAHESRRSPQSLTASQSSSNVTALGTHVTAQLQPCMRDWIIAHNVLQVDRECFAAFKEYFGNDDVVPGDHFAADMDDLLFFVKPPEFLELCFPGAHVAMVPSLEAKMTVCQFHHSHHSDGPPVKATENSTRKAKDTVAAIFVRRRAASVLLSLTKTPVFWLETFLLNVIVHSTYHLVVAVCQPSRDVKKPGLCVKHHVLKRVFASPSRAQPDEQKTVSYVWTWPVIYWNIEDHEALFAGMVVGPEDYFCVELTVSLPDISLSHDHRSTSLTSSTHTTASSSAMPTVFTDTLMFNSSSGNKVKDHTGYSNVVVFQGTVPFATLKHSCLLKRHSTLSSAGGRADRLPSVRQVGPDFLTMRGPSFGTAQVAVLPVSTQGSPRVTSSLSSSSSSISALGSPPTAPKKKSFISDIFQTTLKFPGAVAAADKGAVNPAATVAREGTATSAAASRVGSVVTDSTSVPNEMNLLRCALTHVAVKWTSALQRILDL